MEEKNGSTRKKFAKLEVSLRKEKPKKEIYEHAQSMTGAKITEKKDSRHYAA